LDQFSIFFLSGIRFAKQWEDPMSSPLIESPSSQDFATEQYYRRTGERGNLTHRGKFDDDSGISYLLKHCYDSAKAGIDHSQQG
jgi:hypothetical protein